jgi:hypothetical protein
LRHALRRSTRWNADVLCHNRTMTKVIDDGIGQLTFLADDGRSFLHVGLADGNITVGCSTRMSLMECFVEVGGVIFDNRDSWEIMGAGSANDAFMIAQGHDVRPHEVDVDLSTVHLPEGWQTNPHEFADKIAKVGYDSYSPAVRVDIGRSSWQWDDLSRSLGPGRNAFGGLLADQSLFNVLVAIVVRVGDDWVHKSLVELTSSSEDFVKKHAR